MEKLPIYLDGQAAGELSYEMQALYTRFDAVCTCPLSGVYRVFAIGKEGELPLGILEPKGFVMRLSRSFSQRLTLPAGELLRGEARLCFLTGEDQKAWKALRTPLTFFKKSAFCGELRDVSGALWREEGGYRFLALPFDSRRPFLLTNLFCFAKILPIGERSYAVFAFDREENPVFR